MNRYKTILADPPWPEKGGGKIKRGADKHYELMSVLEIVRLGSMVKDLRDPGGCHLYLWVTNNHLPAGLEVMSSWGFEYITVITWLKDKIGLGQYFRGITEHCLFGKYGQLPYKIDNDGGRMQGVTGFRASRTIHSRKPEGMMEMVMKVSYPPYIELFARPPHPNGWDTWGLESDGGVTVLQKSLMVER